MTTPERFQATCERCGEIVDTRPDRGAFRWESGWAAIRSHGTNALALREVSDRYACRACVQLRRLESKSPDWTQLSLEGLDG